MRVRHKIQIQCNCPSDKLPDLYECIVECERTIPVERIMKLADKAARKRVYQEELTQWLARRLNARVTTTGWHFGRVQTTVEA